jgi:hypothetical protein
MLNLNEVKKRILEDRDWQSRSIDIEIFHFQLMLTARKKWSIRKTAKALGLCASTVCEDLMLAIGTIDYPELPKIKNRRDALKFIRENK